MEKCAEFQKLHCAVGRTFDVQRSNPWIKMLTFDRKQFHPKQNEANNAGVTQQKLGFAYRTEGF